MAKKTAITIDFRQFDRDIAAFDKKKTQQLKNLVQETAINIEREAKELVPVDSGRLRSDIQIGDEAIDGLEVKVGTNVEYAPHVEFGTKNMPAQPYLNPAAEGERKNFNKKLQKIISTT